MSNPVIVICIIMGIGSILIVGINIYRTNRLMDDLENMLDQAISGEYMPGRYDESRLSKLEEKLKRFLDSSTISAKNVEMERDRIKTLISDISHQTKTPIANLVLYSELMQDTELSAEQKSNVRIIYTQTRKLQFLIDSLIKLSRLENGIFTLEKSKTDVGKVLESVCDTYQAKANEKGLRLGIIKTESYALIDAKWTIEAISNIVDNAIKYTPEGEIRLSIREYEMFVRVDISDTGIGIALEDQAEVFKRFHRASRVKDEEGVGIGLFLAREIISMEGGYVKLQSEVGKGTTFSVYLPKE